MFVRRDRTTQVILVVRPCSKTCREDTRYETKQKVFRKVIFLGVPTLLKPFAHSVSDADFGGILTKDLSSI